MSVGQIVIVGGGHAAYQLCASLVEAGEGSRVHLVCEEGVPPYQRPPLSKAYLMKGSEAVQVFHDSAWYLEQGVHLHLGIAAVAIDRSSGIVTLATGERLSYEKLVLATGARARNLVGIHEFMENVVTLRTVRDAEIMRQRLLRTNQGELLVVGGGFVGLEVAAVARKLGWTVTILEASSRLLSRAVSPDLSTIVLKHHLAMGTQVEFNALVNEHECNGTRLSWLSVNSNRRAVDELLIGIGSLPEVELARNCGLMINDGLVVNTQMQTSDPNILAIGDCTSFPFQGKLMRLESVQNATDQAKIAAATLLGKVVEYLPTPSFWSDQSGLRLQMAGLWRPGLKAVLRTGANTQSGSLFHFDNSELVAVESFNSPVDHMMARKLLELKKSPTPSEVADVQIALKGLL